MKNIIFPLNNIEKFTYSTSSLEGMPITRNNRSFISMLEMKDSPKYEKFSNLTESTSDAEYMEYVNNMMKIQESLEKLENTLDFHIGFYLNKNK